jgi:hypothetical protein
MVIVLRRAGFRGAVGGQVWGGIDKTSRRPNGPANLSGPVVQGLKSEPTSSTRAGRLARWPFPALALSARWTFVGYLCHLRAERLFYGAFAVHSS